MRLFDVPRLPPHCFRADNMIRRHFAQPCYRDIATGRIVVERPWQVIGWSDDIDGCLMHGREDYMGLMLHHPEYGEWWEHYPLMDEDDRREAVFEAKGNL